MHRIYLITTRNDKKYVGYTSRSIHTRLREHLKSARKGRTKFYNCLRKHGFKSIELLVEFKSELQALEYEINYITEHPGLLNTSSGGEGRDFKVNVEIDEMGNKHTSVEPRGGKRTTRSPKKRVPSRNKRRRR